MIRRLSLAVASMAAVASPALAEDAAKPAAWSDTIKFGLQIEAGIVGNPAGPKDNLNFGQSFTDRANEPVMNQALFVVGRALDPKATTYDFGFKFQGMYGTDSRYTHFSGLLDRAVPNGRYQFDVVEASVSLHTPWLTEGGIDLQAGLYPTPLGYEVIDPSGNPFYSHSYIFNFGLPFKHAGGNAIVHVNDMIDLYAGVDAGTNTQPFGRNGDNNDAAAFLGGAKLTLMGGNLTVLALTHIGPENAVRAVGTAANNSNRYYNDITATYKFSDTLSITTELNYVKDDLARAEAYGLAQYVSYAITDKITLNGRAEVFRDTKGFFVAGFPTALGPVLALEGYPAPAVAYGKTTYGALTFGATYKPDMPAPIKGLMLRPEIRYDQVLDGGKNFNAGKDRGALTISADAIISF